MLPILIALALPPPKPLHFSIPNASRANSIKLDNVLNECPDPILIRGAAVVTLIMRKTRVTQLRAATENA